MNSLESDGQVNVKINIEVKITGNLDDTLKSKYPHAIVNVISINKE